MFTINRAALAAELAIIQAAVEKKGTIPVLAFCLFEIVGNETKITGTDLDVTITTSVENSESDGDWSFGIPARQLHSLVNLFEDETATFSLNPKNERIQVVCGSSVHLLPSCTKEQFPDPDRANPETVEVDAELLGQMLRSVNLAIETKMGGDEKYKSVRFALEKGKLELTTSDGTELANATIAIPDKKTTFTSLLPRRAAQVLTSFLDGGKVKVGFAENHALFINGNRQMTARLIHLKFPDWKMIIPKGDPHKMFISNTELQAATKRVMVTVEDYALTKVIKTSLSKNEITLESRGGDSGQSTETVSTECASLNGDTIQLGINGAQLLDFLGIAKDTVTMEVWEATKPIRLSLPHLPFNYQYITQPTRFE
jgi:DNA polymerase-3 subunit beta